jgi:hypothetical protein
MRSSVVGSVYVVQAIKDDKTEFWAAATVREKAVAAVERELGDGWTVTLTDRRLTRQRLSMLKMLPNAVRRLCPTISTATGDAITTTHRITHLSI